LGPHNQPDANPHGDSHTNAKANAHTDPHGDSHTDTKAYTNTDPYGNSHTNTTAYTHTDPYGNTDTNTDSHPRWRCGVEPGQSQRVGHGLLREWRRHQPWHHRGYLERDWCLPGPRLQLVERQLRVRHGQLYSNRLGLEQNPRARC
jgi:hypothetical protein